MRFFDIIKERFAPYKKFRGFDLAENYSKAKIHCYQRVINKRSLHNGDNTNHTAINFAENDFILEEAFSSFYLHLFPSSALDRRRLV